jgi:hypothetical protein
MSEPVSQPPYPDGPAGAPGTPAAPGTGYPPYPPYSPYPGYPAYPAYPGYPLYSQAPGYPPIAPPPPRKDNTRTVYVIVGVVVAALVVLCAAGGVLFSTLGNAAQHSLSNLLSSGTADEFCLDEQDQNYSSAYTLLSANLQQQYSQSQFTQDGQQHDSSLGTITNCTPSGTASVTGQTATLTVSIERTLTPTPDASGTVSPPQTSDSSGQIMLVEVSGRWLVNDVDPTLNML